MKRPNTANWLKRSNRFVPFEFFSADPNDYKKYIDNEDCPPSMLAIAWEDVKSKIEDLKNNFFDIASSGDLDNRCNNIRSVIDSIIRNENTPEDVAFEMMEINWQAFRNRCTKMDWNSIVSQLVEKNSYENLVKIFENSMNKLSFDFKKSNFTSYVHDSIYALNTMRVIINGAVWSKKRESIGDSEVFIKYIKNNQLKIIESFENLMSKTFLSRDKEVLNELHRIAMGAEENYHSNAFFSQIWAIILLMQVRSTDTGRISYNQFGIGSETIKKSFDLTQKMSSDGSFEGFGFVPKNPAMKMYKIRLNNVKHRLGMPISNILA